MKKVKNQEAPLHSVIGYTTYGASYGKVIYTDRSKYKYPDNKDYYFVGFNLDMFERGITIYKSEKKPTFKNISFLTAIWTPVVVLAYILLFLLVILTLFIDFYKQCLFRKSFITENYETVSGYISLILSIIGLITIIKFFI